MAQPVPNPPGFEALSTDEKIDYVESLWDHTLERDEIAVAEWHRELLRERLDADGADSTAGRSWGEVRAELQRKYPSRP